jgi:hypothetical protein
VGGAARTFGTIPEASAADAADAAGAAAVAAWFATTWAPITTAISALVRPLASDQSSRTDGVTAAIRGDNRRALRASGDAVGVAAGPATVRRRRV